MLYWYRKTFLKGEQMLLSTIKIVMFLYPFLRELLIGKYSKDARFRNFKLMFVVIALSSLIANYVLIRQVYSLSVTKIEHVKTIKELNEKIKDKPNVIYPREINSIEQNTPVDKPTPHKPIIPEKDKVVIRKEDDEEDPLHKRLREINNLD